MEEGIQTILPPGKIKFDEMSDNLVMSIIEKLPLSSVALLSTTSKRMHRLCHDPQNWSNIKLTNSSKELSPYNIAVLCAKGSEIRHLSIDLSAKSISSASLRLLSISCPSIISLSLYLTSEFSIGSNMFPITELVSFLTNSKSVRSLRFTDSTMIDDSHLVQVLPHLQMMREIDLSGCITLSDSTLIKLAQQCPSLQLLDISKLPINGRCIEPLFRYCGGLKTLRANYCTSFQTDQFSQVSPESLKNLVELSVIGTPVSLEPMLQHCVSLRHLLASLSLHDSILIPFLYANRRLETLYMGSGCRVTISSLICAIQTCGNHLISLTFHPFDTFAVPHDEVMRLICCGCPRLKHLSFAHSEEISTYWVIEAMKKLDLESLALFGWKNGNSSALRLIVPEIRTLRMLCISGCQKLTVPGVVNFILAANTLKVLKLEETGVNLQNGMIIPDVIEGIREKYPQAKETSPGILFIQ